jgi:hypothetical protein
MPKESIMPFGENVPSPIANGNAFWDTYSESAALVAYSYHCFKTNKRVPDLTTRFEGLKRTTSETKYVNNLVIIDSLQYSAIVSMSLGKTKDALSKFNQAADLEARNVKTADSPTLPVIPAQEMYGSYLHFIGDEKESKKVLALSDTQWNDRTNPLK